MTILSLINPDATGRDLDITQLRQQVQTLIEKDIDNLLPPTQSSTDFYSNATQGGLLAFLSLLRAKLGLPVRLEEYIGPIDTLSDVKKKQLLDVTHRDYTQDGASWTATNFPIFEAQPEIEAVINEFSIFLDFLDEGARAGATLLNSDHPVATDEVAPGEASTDTTEQATVVDGLPEEEEAAAAEGVS